MTDGGHRVELSIYLVQGPRSVPTTACQKPEGHLGVAPFRTM